MIKEESQRSDAELMQIDENQAKRQNFNLYFGDQVEDKSEAAKPQQASAKVQDEASFKKFLLACMWDKRIPKNEILMMDLAQNIFMLRQAVKDDRVSLS